MKNLKQRLGMAALLLSFGMYVSAQEFVVNGVRYIDNGDGTATIKEYRDIKGEGYVGLEETIKKNDKKYTVTGIASDAFKGINVKILYLPESLKTISSHAFESSNLNLRRGLSIPGSVEKIEDNAFGDNPKISDLYIEGSEDAKPFLLRGTEFSSFPVKRLGLWRDIDTLSISPFKNSSTLESVSIGENLKLFPADFFEGCSALKHITINTKYGWDSTLEGIESRIQTVSCVRNATQSLTGVNVYMDNRDHPINPFDYLAELERLRDEKREEENAIRLKFINQCAEFIRTMEEEPEALNRFSFDYTYKNKHYGADNSFEKYPDVWMTAFNFVCDSIFLTKEELTDIDKNIGHGICNDQINIMLFDTLQRTQSQPLERWAYYNMLNDDPHKELHKKNYERILEVSEKLIKSGSSDKNYDPCYEMLTQLVGLCGMDKWKEAEQYFPKVHRAITKNGKYNVPDPLTYIQKCLTERGYKATAPAYAKTTTTATAKEPTNAQMVEFFINRGIEIYKDKQAQKKREEMYRQMMLEEARKQAQKK